MVVAPAAVVVGAAVVVVPAVVVVGNVQSGSANVTAKAALVESTRCQPAGSGSTHAADASVMVAVTTTESPGAYGPEGSAAYATPSVVTSVIDGSVAVPSTHCGSTTSGATGVISGHGGNGGRVISKVAVAGLTIVHSGGTACCGAARNPDGAGSAAPLSHSKPSANVAVTTMSVSTVGSYGPGGSAM